MDLNVRLLRYFVTVVDEGHFARAAARLYVTPPALTLAVRRLEREVGFALLDRMSRPVVPTPAGEIFLIEARRVLDVAGRASTVALSLARSVTDRFVLGFNTTLLGPHTRGVVEAFTRKFGPDSLKLVELPLSERTEGVRSGRVDASLVFEPVTEPRLRVDPALLTARVLVVAADHRLARCPSVSLAEAAREVHVVAGDGDEEYVRWWLGEPRAAGGARIERVPVSTLAEGMEQVAGGRAVAILPQIFAYSHSRADIKYIPIDDLPPCRVMLCTRSDDDSPMTAHMRRIIADLASSASDSDDYAATSNVG